MSVCEIETAETYEKGRPKRGGLSDPRMGTMDRAMKCETDGMGSTDTPGYFGHLELAKPVYHHGFIKNVISVLRCVGFSSSKLMIDKVRHDAWAKKLPPPARAENLTGRHTARATDAPTRRTRVITRVSTRPAAKRPRRSVAAMPRDAPATESARPRPRPTRERAR